MIVTHKFEGGDKGIWGVGLQLKRLEGKGYGLVFIFIVFHELGVGLKQFGGVVVVN